MLQFRAHFILHHVKHASLRRKAVVLIADVMPHFLHMIQDTVVLGSTPAEYLFGYEVSACMNISAILFLRFSDQLHFYRWLLIVTLR